MRLFLALLTVCAVLPLGEAFFASYAPHVAGTTRMNVAEPTARERGSASKSSIFRAAAAAPIVRTAAAHSPQAAGAAYLAPAAAAAAGASSSWHMMAKVGKGGPGNIGSKGQPVQGGGGTGTAVITKDKIKEQTGEKVQRKEQLDKESWWRVILHNDEIHTFDYVTKAITKVIKTLTMKIAYDITMETHKAGKATVTTAWKQQAETYCLQLQQCGLTASIAPDANFQNNRSGGSGE